MIKRQVQVQIAQLLEEFPAVRVLGARQVGKTTMAEAMANSAKPEPIYLDLERPGAENARSTMNEFRRKLDYLSKFKLLLDKECGRTGGIVFEASYWGLSIAEAEHVKPEKLNSPVFKDRLIKFLAKHIKEFTVPRTYFYHFKNDNYDIIVVLRTTTRILPIRLHETLEMFEPIPLRGTTGYLITQYAKILPDQPTLPSSPGSLL